MVHHYDIVALDEQTLSSLTHIVKVEALNAFIYIYCNSSPPKDHLNIQS
jgi:hypothetical protein